MNDLQSTFLILSASFPPLAIVSSVLFRDNFENCCSFSLRPVESSSPKVKTGSVFLCLLSNHFPPCFDRAVGIPNRVHAIGHFRVPQDLRITTRLSAQPLIWKYIFYSHANKTHSQEMLCTWPHFWKWGFSELGSGLLLKCTRTKTVQEEEVAKVKITCNLNLKALMYRGKESPEVSWKLWWFEMRRNGLSFMLDL